MFRYVRFALLVVAAFAVVPSTAFAQASIAGIVKDSSGAVLPGVTVEAASPVLIEKVRIAVSDGTGRYTIDDVRPGTYAITFTLPGFATVKREGVELSGTSTTTVNGEMRVGAVTETITVTGETPNVDVQNTVRQRVLNHEVLDVLPASRAPGQLAGLTSNVTVSTSDVGGASGDGSSRGSITARGVSDSRMMIAGIVTQTGAGTSHGVYNMESYDEVVVDTGAVSAETYSGGVRINFIPRDGGNRFSGSFVGAFANASMSGSNQTPELQAAGLPAPATVKQLADVNPSFGGPIMHDKLWFYSSARWDRAFNFASVRYNANAGNPNVWTYVPDLTRDAASTENTLKNGNVRLTWQANARNKLAFVYDNSKICDCPRTLTATTAPESSLNNYNTNPRVFETGEWSAPLSSRLLMEANFYHIHSDAYRPRVNPFFASGSVPLIQVTEQSTGLVYRGTASVPESINNPTTVRFAASYTTGAHAFKVGVTYGTIGQSRETYSTDAPIAYRFRNGVPNQLTIFATPFTALVDGSETGLFVQDKWTVSRFTISGGLRYDGVQDSFPAQTIGPGNYTPNRNLVFPKTDGANWKDLSPRLGLVADVFGNGRTAVKLSANKYLSSDVSGGAFGIGSTPANTMISSTSRSWTDRNSNFVPDCDLLNPAAQTVTGGDICGAWANVDFGKASSVLALDPDFVKGWNHRPNNWQFSAGVQQELMPRVSVSVDFWRTIVGNLAVVDNLAYGPGDFDQFSIVAPVDPRLPGGGGYVISGLYDVKPAAFGRAANGVATSASKFGGQMEHWNGVDVNFNARLRSGLLFQGGVTTQRQTTDSCADVSQVAATPPPDRGGSLPTYNPSLQFCHVQGTFLTQLKMLASARIPRIDVQVSGSLQNLPGPERAAVYTATTAQVATSLGRPLAGAAATVNVNLIEPRSMYGDRTNQLDVRISKILRFGSTTRATVGVDFYNALNASGVLSENSAFATWLAPTSILNARFAKAVFQLNF